MAGNARLTAATAAVLLVLLAVEGVTISPSHIALRPRTNVPTGQPVTLLPS